MDADGNVVSYWNQGLSTVPEEVFAPGAERKTRVLVLAGNALTTIPGRLRELRGLRTLDLGHNRLTALPEGILEGLHGMDGCLYLHGNRLSGLPHDLGALRRLTWLNVSANPLERLPSSLVRMRALRELRAQHAALTSLPGRLGELGALRELWLRGNLLDSLPASTGALTELRELELRENRFSEVPGTLRGLPKLRRLDLRANLLGEIPGWLGELPALEKLDVRWNPVLVPTPLRRNLEAQGCAVLD